MKISSTKTEHRAINALKAIIDEHSTMEHQINENDKEMSWDGFISLYKENNGDQSKPNFDARVPVQIKGHHDPEHKYIGKSGIIPSVTPGCIRSQKRSRIDAFSVLRRRDKQRQKNTKSLSLTTQNNDERSNNQQTKQCVWTRH